MSHLHDERSLCILCLSLPVLFLPFVLLRVERKDSFSKIGKTEQRAERQLVQADAQCFSIVECRRSNDIGKRKGKIVYVRNKVKIEKFRRWRVCYSSQGNNRSRVEEDMGQLQARNPQSQARSRNARSPFSDRGVVIFNISLTWR